MLFPDMYFPWWSVDRVKAAAASDSYDTWHPDREEVSAAADYALDGTARSYGANGDDRRTGQGGDWSPPRSHRWWLIDHRAGLA